MAECGAFPEMDEFFALAVVVIPGVIIYFAPTIVAYTRGHRNTVAIAALNILLGWTFVGWVIALVWALLAQEQSAD